jgi:hypothetical protein
MAKVSFVGGFALGLLVGSRIGPGLYERASSAASAVARSPQVRRGATAAGDRATHAAKAAGTSAAAQVKHAGEAVANRFGDRLGDRFGEHFGHHDGGNGAHNGITSPANGATRGDMGERDD